MTGQFHDPSHPDVLKKKVNINWEYPSKVFYSQNILGVPKIVNYRFFYCKIHSNSCIFWN